MIRKLRALWYILTGKGLIYNVFFDSEYPVVLAKENMENGCLVMGCRFVIDDSKMHLAIPIWRVQDEKARL